MAVDRAPVYNLSKARPKVLILGNGIIYDQSISWNKLIESVCRDEIDISKYEKKDDDGQFKHFYVPNSILTMATSIIRDSERRKQYVKILNNQTCVSNSYIDRLLKVKWDAVLTTNYTYEIEASINPSYPRLSNEAKRNYAPCYVDKKDSKYLLHMCNHISTEHPGIWHIHGELRRPTSMILSHDEYARFIQMLLNHNKARSDDYHRSFEELKITSWVDYFIVGDVYVLGLGMDFSEFDLWWLLGRRLREKSGHGKMVFYEPFSEKNKYKQLALSDSGVSVKTLNKNIDNGDTFHDFYCEAICELENEMNKT